MSNFKRNQQDSTFTAAEFWINIGIEVGDKVVTLPVGIPIGSDTKGRGAEQASLLQAVIGMAQQVPAGQQQELQGLKVFLRHVDDAPAKAVDLGLKLKLK